MRLTYLRSFKQGQAQDLLDVVKAMGQMQTFLDAGDQHVSADRNPDLRLHRVPAGPQKRLDAKKPEVCRSTFKSRPDKNAKFGT